MEGISFLKPAEGMKVRDPLTLVELPASGRRVRMSSYWRRRLLDGDVLLIEDQQTSGQGDDK